MPAPRSSGGAGRRPPAVVRRVRAAGPGGVTAVVVHPGALAPTVYQTLAAALPEGDGLTVLDLGSLPDYWEPALTGAPADTTVEDLAGRLLAELDATHPDPAPVLAGWSFGGVVAHTMVALTPRARRPARLVLLDSIAPLDDYQRADDELDTPLLLGWFAMYLGAKRGRAVECPPERLATASADDGLTAVLDAATAAGALPADVTLPGVRKLYDTYVDGLLRNNRLTLGHRPAPASVPLVLVKAARSLIPGDRDLGWGPLAHHGLDILPSPGDHYTMLTRPDAAAVIAQALSGRPAAEPAPRGPHGVPSTV